MTEAEEREWEERLAQAVADTLRKRAAKRAERLEFQTRRNYGKASYHAAKLARNRRPPSTDPSTGPPTKEN